MLEAGIEPRRADMALAWLMENGVVVASDLRHPSRVIYEDLARVHSPELLESLESARELARVYAVAPSDIVVDEVLQTVRIACGATLEAARSSLSHRTATLNLLGGFHHAGPAREDAAHATFAERFAGIVANLYGMAWQRLATNHKLAGIRTACRRRHMTVGQLAAIAVLRTALNFTLEREVERAERPAADFEPSLH